MSRIGRKTGENQIKGIIIKAFGIFYPLEQNFGLEIL
jgi:hypothetical protein